MSKVPLHVLPGFVAAARARNLSRAAASLHVTVSALSHQMRGLEELLGHRLFHRGPRAEASPRRVSGGPAGGPATPSTPSRRRWPLSRSATRTCSRSASCRRSPLAGSSPGFRASPCATPRWSSISSRRLTSSTSTGGGRRRDPLRPGRLAELRTHLLFEEWVIPVCSPELLQRFPQAARGDFTGVPLLRDLNERWHAWFERFGGVPPTRWVAAFDDTDALQRAAMEGMGVALGRLTMARPLIESGRLVALTPNRLLDRYAHYLVYPPRSENHPAVIAFRAWILGVAAPRGQLCRPNRLPRRAHGLLRAGRAVAALIRDGGVRALVTRSPRHRRVPADGARPRVRARARESPAAGFDVDWSCRGDTGAAKDVHQLRRNGDSARNPDPRLGVRQLEALGVEKSRLSPQRARASRLKAKSPYFRSPATGCPMAAR